jgi:DNA-binding transcriptional ArsR family regulator
MRALSDPIRVEALIRLATGECCRISVSDLAGQVAVSVSNLSYHLTRLHEAGVLGRSRDHRAVNYWIVRDFLPLIRAVYETSRSRETVRPLRQGV